MIHKQSIWLLLSGSLLPFCLEDYAYAYIDPGSGSYLFQIILATLIGVAFALKSCWLKLKNFLKRISRKDSV